MKPRTLSIYTEELPYAWKWTPDNYVGGTHEFVVNTARCCGFEDVAVYYDGCPGDYDGILYLPRSAWDPDDVTLICNTVPHKLGKYNIFWSNHFGLRDSDYDTFDERIVISPYHKRIFGSNSRVVPHSCWPDEFKNPKKNLRQCLYSSSPDRGGDFLRDIWPEVQERTDANLIMTYKSEILDHDMIDLYKQSEFWLHPCQGIELFCIAAVKAQVAGCIPVVVPNMALETTVKYGVKTTIENYKEDLIQAIINPPSVEKVNFGTWQTVTDELFRNVSNE